MVGTIRKRRIVCQIRNRGSADVVEKSAVESTRRSGEIRWQIPHRDVHWRGGAQSQVIGGSNDEVVGDITRHRGRGSDSQQPGIGVDREDPIGIAGGNRENGPLIAIRIRGAQLSEHRSCPRVFDHG